MTKILSKENQKKIIIRNFTKTSSFHMATVSQHHPYRFGFFSGNGNDKGSSDCIGNGNVTETPHKRKNHCKVLGDEF